MEQVATQHAGGVIARAGWIADALFAVTAVPAAAGVTALVDVAIAVALLEFLAAIVAFGYAFAVGVARTARGDDVAVASLYFLQGSAPPNVRRVFLEILGASVVIAAATAVWAPFGVLVPMLPLGLAGVWGARHGVFPPRPAATGRR